MSTIYDWDVWADHNDRADDAINWLEGQAPSTVNNSARAMMQRIREYIADVGGSLVGKMESNAEQKTSAITLTTNSKFKKYVDGMVLRFKSNGTNLGSTTISVNTLTPVHVFMSSDEGYHQLLPKAIQSGGVYEIVYTAEDNQWILLNPTYVLPDPLELHRIIPIGTICAFAMNRVPNGWLACNGQAVSRKTYKDLLDVIGLTYGIGDGDQTFNVPDLRGVFLRGLDAGGGR